MKIGTILLCAIVFSLVVRPLAFGGTSTYTYTYDKNGRVTEIDRSEGSKSSSTTYSYDASGNTLSETAVAPVDGSCGSAVQGSYTTAPTSNLCSAGVATAVAGTGPWTWQCLGQDGGTTAGCLAAITAYSVGANATGSGSGGVSSNPSGIAFAYPAANTGAAQFNYGREVVLTAAASLGSTASWSGTCTAAGGVESGNNTASATCTLNDLIGAKNVTATFVMTVGIMITSPNGGEVWTAGTKENITWKYTGNPGSSVKIDLLKDGAASSAITSKTSIGKAGKGSYPWSIPAGQAAGTTYRVRVASVSNGSYSGQSSQDFAVAGPTITVVSPNGGESWKAGKPHAISWKYTGNPGKVKIDLIKGGVSTTIVSSVSAGKNGAGSYNWKINSKQTAGGDYKIRVTSTTWASCTGMSGNPFAITGTAGARSNNDQ